MELFAGCSLAGPRSGHSAIAFQYLNSQSVMLIFGGQTTAELAVGHPYAAKSGTFLNDVLTGKVSPVFAPKI